ACVAHAGGAADRAQATAGARPVHVSTGRQAMKIIPPLLCIATLLLAARAEAQQTYENRLKPIADPKPLLADHPQWVEPVRETRRFEAPMLVSDEGADLEVRA